MNVREAGVDDVDSLARLRTAWRGTEATDEFVDQLREWFLREQRGRWWWVAQTETGDVIGMVNVKLFDRMPSPAHNGSRWGYLANLYVDPAHRRSGVGSALINAAVQRAQAEGLVRLVVSPSDQARPLFVASDFRDAHELLLRPLDDA